jgi:exonuclease III
MIQVCHINITSIRKHKDELASRFFKYDIISINEFNLEKDRPFTLQGFNIFRKDRIDKSGGGGVLLAIKESIKCHEIFNRAVEKNEIVAVQIESKTFKSMLIASIYVPSTAKIHLNVFHDLYKLNNNCLIVGDLNAALYLMGSRKTNAKGRQLQELLNEAFVNCIEDDMITFERNNYEEKNRLDIS